MSNKNEKMSKQTDSYIQQYIRKKDRMKELVLSQEYIKWLEKFTKKHPTFDDKEWLYFPEKISKEDNAMVELLSEFFGVIEDFADNYYIYPNGQAHEEYYTIEYNGKRYEIGVVVGQGAICFCNTKDVDEDAQVIPYSEILNPTYIKTLKENVEHNLDELENFLKTLNTRNIPLKAIEQKTRVVLGELKKEKSKG